MSHQRGEWPVLFPERPGTYFDRPQEMRARDEDTRGTSTTLSDLLRSLVSGDGDKRKGLEGLLK